MRRWTKRAALAGAAMVAAAVAAPARTQTPERVYRLGQISLAAESSDVILPELARLGFAEGRNLVVDMRIGAEDALPGLARELLATRPDAILAIGPQAVSAAGGATRTVPIVAFGPNPVDLGFAASFARPGGNLTGVVILGAQLGAKRLQLLHEAVPGARRVAVLFTTTFSGRAVSERELRAAAANAGIDLLDFDADAPADYPAAFAAMRAAGAQALVFGSMPQFSRDITILAALALESRLPTVCEFARHARDGCLIGYGPDTVALRRRMADQIARIFRGTAPGEIPIEQPTRFEFAVNLRVARALGLELPPTILALADEVIE